MRIRHILSSGTVRRDTTNSGAFFLRNSASFLALQPERTSRYHGWFVENTATTPSRFTKLLEHIIYTKGDNAFPEPSGITITDAAAFWEYGDGTKIGYQLTEHQAGLQIKASRATTLRIILDIRDMYSQPEFGRNYSVTRVAGGVVVKYTDGKLAEPVYLHIQSNEMMSLTSAWEKVSYPWDAARHSDPSELFVYTLGDIETEKICFGAGATPEEAQLACSAAARIPLETLGIGTSYSDNNSATEVICAKAGAERALEWLDSAQGIYAGLPWFHQVWSRDELLGALGASPDKRRSIIQRYLALPLQHGELPTFLGSGTTCADGIGWLALLLREHGTHELNDSGRQAVARFFEEARTGLQQARLGLNGLIHSGHNSTWMDTIGREGYRIEIQCMYALVLELLGELTGEEHYFEEQKTFLAHVRELFFHDGYLWDGADDPTMRPNVFLAYLLQPELLTEEEWKSCFSHIIRTCSTEWGGLTSVDKNDGRFQPLSTGENNQSYHEGDSWFFVNNLAATALARCDTTIYAQTVNRLLMGSTEEILWKHFLGLPGEIASAADGESWGCGIQAFSAGPYLFLLRELELGS